MRQEQPRIEPPPHRHLLAVIEHGLLHPIERPRRQHFLDMPPRQHQRRIPPLREKPIPPPQHISRLPAHPDRRRRRAHVAPLSQPVQKPNLPLRRPGIVRALPGTGRGSIRSMVEGTRDLAERQIGRTGRTRENARAIALALPNPSRRARWPRSALPASKPLTQPIPVAPPTRRAMRRIKAAIALDEAPGSRKGLPRQPDIARRRNPPPPGSGGIGRV